MLVVLASLLLSFQDPAPAPAPQDPKPANPPAQAPVEPPKPVALWNDAEAKAAIDSYTRSLKDADSMAAKSKALDILAPGAHKLLVKPLAQMIESEKSIVIKKRAAELLGQQPAADANATILKLVRNSRVAQHPPVLAELVKALANCGYKPAQWKEINELFERDYGAEFVALHEAILGLIEKHKEKQAIDLLLRNMDEPVPENVDAADNPPAEYWEARWKAWKAWRGKVKDALFAITGQRFSTRNEAKAWLRKNPIK
ncbi:MAG: hypothetical protein IPK26_18315 [Planctomycetes bacterium]|nr:hypothetical protein [Planctomycetota bacterium]